MKLPFFISIPHGSLDVPDEIKDIWMLAPDDLLKDSDEGAIEIYSELKDEVVASLFADVARAVVDLNRAPDDLGGDGVIKSETCYQVPVYRKFPDDRQVSSLLDKYYFPYHEKLSSAVGIHGVKLGLDCHTMLETGPPVGPDSGKKRPLICLSNAETSCPLHWLESLAAELQAVFQEKVTINSPFKGGYIIRQHAVEMPWIQVEFSRTPSFSLQQKGRGLLAALQKWVVDQGIGQV